MLSRGINLNILSGFSASILIYTCGEFLFIPAVGDLAIEACSLPSLWKKEETGHFRVISKKATRLALKMNASEEKYQS